MSPYVPEECDTPESQREFFDVLARAIDEEEARQPSPSDLRDEMDR